jgi:hypothetical protein
VFSNGLEKPGRIRTESGLNEHLGQHKNVTGPSDRWRANVLVDIAKVLDQ